MRQIISDKKNVKYCFTDTETQNTALNEVHNLPWQISLISVVNNQIKKEYDFYLKWPKGECIVSEEAAKITNYDHEKVQKEGVDPREIMPILQKEFDKADFICGHNILGFDCDIIQSLCVKLGWPLINIAKKALDTFAIGKGIRIESFPKSEKDLIPWQYRMYHYKKKGLNKLRLEDLGKEYGIDFDPNLLHNSLNDLRLNVKVFNHQKNSFSYTE